MKALLLTLIISLATLILPGAALAHGVETDYFVNRQSTLEIQSKFSTGEPLQAAPVKIYAPNDTSKPWLEGQTDADGRFAFKPERSLQGEWTVEIGDTEGSEHSDMLSVPVTQQGVDVNQISQELPQSHPGRNLLVGLGFAGVFGVFGIRLKSFLR